MSGPFFEAVERARLSDLLDELGPGAPTLLTRGRPAISPRTWSCASTTTWSARGFFRVSWVRRLASLAVET
jgi:hypothetical protein